MLRKVDASLTLDLRIQRLSRRPPSNNCDKHYRHITVRKLYECSDALRRHRSQRSAEKKKGHLRIRYATISRL